MSVAEVLGSFTDFVGSPADAHCLFPPLEALCRVEESTVRDMSVTSINQIAKGLEVSQLQQHLAPLVLRLAKSSDWFTPRVSACGLFAAAYKACAESPQGVELRSVFCKDLCADDSPMVRRAAAARLAEMAEALSTSAAIEAPRGAEGSLLSQFIRLLSDEQESIRVNALRGAAEICRRISLQSKLQVLKEHLKKCVADRAWRVRIACAEVIADVAAACVAEPETRQPLEELYLSLQKDHEQEVRVATALRGAKATKALGPTFGKEAVFPVIHALVHDQNSLSRVELSKVLMDMAAPLERDGALELVLPLIRLLSEDENTNVRLSVIHRLDDFIGVVGLGGAVDAELLPLVVRLAEDKNWRVRHAVLLLFPVLAQELGPVAFQQQFGALLKAAANDCCALIRDDFVVVMGQIAQSGDGDGAGFGTEWLESAVAPELLACTSHKNYQFRAVLLTGICVLAGMFTANTLENRLLPPALDMAEDKVPNLRIAAAAALRAAAAHVSADLLQEKVIPRLQMLAQDEDIDVKFMADEALKELAP